MGRVDINVAKTRAVVRIASRPQLDDAARSLLRLCQEECPVITGRLLASHRINRVSEDRREIEANAPYAQHVYDGEGPRGARRPNRWMQRAIDRARL